MKTLETDNWVKKEKKRKEKKKKCRRCCWLQVVT